MRINFAVIGTNKITDRFLAAAAEVEDFCLKGVYSRTMERAEVYGKKHGAEIYFDCLKELAACSQIHACSNVDYKYRGSADFKYSI